MARRCSAASGSKNWPRFWRALKGRFILSLNDVEGVRETFKAFRFREVKTTYTIAAKGAAARAGRGADLEL